MNVCTDYIRSGSIHDGSILSDLLNYQKIVVGGYWMTIGMLLKCPKTVIL